MYKVCSNESRRLIDQVSSVCNLPEHERAIMFNQWSRKVREHLEIGRYDIAARYQAMEDLYFHKTMAKSNPDRIYMWKEFVRHFRRAFSAHNYNL